MKRSSDVLIVDDSAEMRSILKALISAAGYRIQEAEDGLHAMALLEEMRPAAIILDMAMPRADGLDVLKWMEGRTHLRNVPVLVLTAFHKMAHPDIMLPGVYRVIGKGEIDYSQLPAIISEMIAA
ncbi:MAG: response regulator [Chloroflexi bacterium]|nr:response regulator [Chloroflexota bacterium]